MVILVIGASSWNARRFLFKIYIFFMQNYVLHKYMFVHMQKYIPWTNKHIVLHM